MVYGYVFGQNGAVLGFPQPPVSLVLLPTMLEFPVPLGIGASSPHPTFFRYLYMAPEPLQVSLRNLHIPLGVLELVGQCQDRTG